MTKDPVCGMVVDEDRAAATVDHRGERYLFCSLACRERFVRDPGIFADPPRRRDLERRS